MPVRTDITEAEAFAAILRVIGRGEVPTQAVVQREVGRGSYPVIASYLALWFERNGAGVASGTPTGGTPALTFRAQIEEMTKLATQELNEAERRRTEILDARGAALDDRASVLEAREASLVEMERRLLDREMAQVELITTLKADREVTYTAQLAGAAELAETREALSASESTREALIAVLDKTESALARSLSEIEVLKEDASRNKGVQEQLLAECARSRDSLTEANNRATTSLAGEAAANATVIRMTAAIHEMRETAQNNGELLNQALARASASEATAAELREVASASDRRASDAAARAEAFAASEAALRESLTNSQDQAQHLNAEIKTLRSDAINLKVERDKALTAAAAAIPLMERLESHMSSTKK